MGRSTKIWRNKLEEYIKDLYFEQRKTPLEISEIIFKEKKYLYKSRSNKKLLK
jgi:hypothetical protein